MPTKTELSMRTAVIAVAVFITAALVLTTMPQALAEHKPSHYPQDDRGHCTFPGTGGCKEPNNFEHPYREPACESRTITNPSPNIPAQCY